MVKQFNRIKVSCLIIIEMEKQTTIVGTREEMGMYRKILQGNRKDIYILYSN